MLFIYKYIKLYYNKKLNDGGVFDDKYNTTNNTT